MQRSTTAGPAPVRPGPGPAGPAGRRPQRTHRPAGGPRHPAADPRLDLARAFAQLWLEVEAGRRPPAHLHRLMDPRLVERLPHDALRGPCTGGRIRRVTGASPGPQRFDAVVVVERAGRAGALAVRLVRDALGWKVTEAACPEAPPLPDEPSDPATPLVAPGALLE